MMEVVHEQGRSEEVSWSGRRTKGKSRIYVQSTPKLQIAGDHGAGWNETGEVNGKRREAWQYRLNPIEMDLLEPSVKKFPFTGDIPQDHQNGYKSKAAEREGTG